MKRIISYSTAIFSFVLLCHSMALAQCADNNVNSGLVFADPSMGPTMVTINGGEYALINVTDGTLYKFSTCGGAGFDTEVTLYEDGTGVFLAENDDFCGLLSTVGWQATFSGTIRVLVDQFPCVNGGGPATITAEVLTGPYMVDPGAQGLVAGTSPGSPCLFTSNETFNGAGVAFNGVFMNAGTTMGTLTEGFVISNGPGNLPGIPSDPDMAALMGVPADEAVNLTFDFVANGDAITFDVVFATDESTPGGNFNDGAGIFISGPGFGARQNVFFTDTNDPSFIPSDVPNDFLLFDTWNENTAVQTVTINGLTTGDTYTIEFVVADGDDEIINSALYVGPITALNGGVACTIGAIPTMGEWGLIILALLLLSFGTVFMMRRQAAFAGGGGNVSFSGGIPFDKNSFGKMLALAGIGVSVIFAAAVFGFGYEMTNADIPGSLIAIPLLAYLLHLLIPSGSNR